MPRFVFLIFALTVLLAPDAARAQSPYVPGQPWASPIATDVTATNYLIDADGSGTLDPGEPVHPIPNAVLTQITARNDFLTPSRKYVYVFGTAVSGCTGPRVYIYKIPATSGQPLIPVIEGECFPDGIAQHQFFDYTPFPDVAFAAIVGDGDFITGDQDIFWVEMSSGTTGYTNNVVFNGVGQITFEPGGRAAFVQHDLGDFDNLSDYAVIELCQDDFATGSNGGATLLQLGPGVADASSVINGSNLDIEVTLNGSPVTQFAIDDCQTLPPDVGACCLQDGSCLDNITELSCESAVVMGTWQGANSTCAAVNCPPPPGPVLSISAAGPSTAPVAQPIVYTLNYSNTGTGPATNVFVNCPLPSGSALVSATNGGFLSGSLVRWSLGTLSPGSGSVSFTVTVACGTPNISVTGYSVVATEATVFGSNTVATSIPQPSTDPITVAITSVDDNGGQLLNNETITHTIDLTNAVAELRENITMSFWAGDVAQFDSVIDAAGGALTGTNFLTWTGDIPASSTISIVLRTRIPECRNQNSTVDGLNRGNAFNLRNNCNAVVGTATPPAQFTLGPVPMTVSLDFPTLTVTSAGFIGPTTLVRKGMTFPAQVTITNNYATVQTGVVVNVPIPTDLNPVGNPPFVGSPPAGTTYDAGTQTIGWTGDLQPQQSVVIDFQVEYPATGPCSSFVSVNGSFGNCANAVNANANVLALPETLSTEHVLGLTPFNGLFRHEVGGSSTLEEYLCASFEIFWGLAGGANGDIWILGVPTVRFNPDTLNIEIYGDDYFRSNMNINNLYDAAVDEATGDVYLAGSEFAAPFNYGRIRRWNPGTGAIDVVFDDTPAPATPTYSAFRQIVLGTDGHLAATSNVGGIVRIDTANFATVQVYDDPAFPGYWGIAMANDGDYLVSAFTFGTGTPRPLAKVDRATGVHTTVVADLNTVTPSNDPFYGMTVTSGDELYLGPQFGAVQRLDLNALTAVGPLFGYTQHVDMVTISGGTSTSVSDDGSTSDSPSSKPTKVELVENVPNPFNPRTTLRFGLPASGHVRLTVHDIRGRLVKTVVDDVLDAGRHDRVWAGQDDDGQSVASGVYFVRLLSLGKARVQKIALTK